MRLGPLILQVCAILIALSLVYVGYAWFASRDFASYVARVQYPSARTPAEKITAFADSPGISCTFTTADFGVALSGRIYVAPAKIRYQITNATTGEIVHRLFDENGLSLWTEKSPFVERVALDAPYASVAPEPILSNVDCVKWTVNKDAFELPLGKPIKNLTGLQ